MSPNLLLFHVEVGSAQLMWDKIMFWSITILTCSNKQYMFVLGETLWSVSQQWHSIPPDQQSMFWFWELGVSGEHLYTVLEGIDQVARYAPYLLSWYMYCYLELDLLICTPHLESSSPCTVRQCTSTCLSIC